MIERERRTKFVGQLRERRKRGRPRSASDTVVTSIKIPTPVYDAICRHALLERQSVHSVLRGVLESFVRSR